VNNPGKVKYSPGEREETGSSTTSLQQMKGKDAWVNYPLFLNHKGQEIKPQRDQEKYPLKKKENDCSRGGGRVKGSGKREEDRSRCLLLHSRRIRKVGEAKNTTRVN